MNSMRWWDFERAIQSVCGEKGVHGLASLYGMKISKRKDALLKWVKKVRMRCIEVTNLDPRLRDRLVSDLEDLEQETQLLGKEEDIEWDLITRLLFICSRLLGYDWMDGKIHRHVLFFQDDVQEWEDIKTEGKIPPYIEVLDKRPLISEIEESLVIDLHEKGLDIYHITTLLKTKKSRIEKILRDYRKSKPKKKSPRSSKLKHAKKP
ncbi:hypothetical protein JW721_05385 [Candidatus Micrarchaeota archaeon]|nr:hypothetical protein [Candidatus Micrarchaeota archaeon]